MPSLSAFFYQQLWKDSNMWVWQNTAQFRTIKHYRVKCQYRVSCILVYLKFHYLKQWRMKNASLSKCSSLLKPALSVLKEHKYGLMPSNTSDCLTKHGNSRFCTCLITVTVSPLPLFTDQQFLYCYGAWCLSSFILTHKIRELNHWVLNLLPPVLHSHPLIFFSLYDSMLQR